MSEKTSNPNTFTSIDELIKNLMEHANPPLTSENYDEVVSSIQIKPLAKSETGTPSEGAATKEGDIAAIAEEAAAARQEEARRTAAEAAAESKIGGSKKKRTVTIKSDAMPKTIKGLETRKKLLKKRIKKAEKKVKLSKNRIIRLK
tara:strand:+ start:766 stop:1203 length:438 start_codon:yes stop_codon:yes gene_type:complete